MKNAAERSPARDDAGFCKAEGLKPPIQAVQPKAKSISATIIAGLGRMNCCTPLRVLPTIPTATKEA